MAAFRPALLALLCAAISLNLSALAAAPRSLAPTVIDADLVFGHNSHYIEASGRVEANNGREFLKADWLRYDQPGDELQARGNVRLDRDGDRIEGDHLKLKLSERLGQLDAVRYRFTRRGQEGRGGAERLHFLGQDRYRLEAASYTTCPVGGEDWALKARDIDLDQLKNLGVARDVRVEYLGTPILYAPWLDFALDDSRKSGFLTPSFGVTDQRGLEVVVPWYWNIAPNRDATFTPRLMTRRGLQLAGELRYLEQDYRGDVNLAVLPGDGVTGNTRHHALLRHEQAFSSRLTGRLLLENVSDDRYFTDLSSLVNQTSRVMLPREGSLSYQGDGWQALLRAQSYQALQDPLAPVVAPHRRLPQLLVNAERDEPGRLNYTFTGEFVRFTHELNSESAGNRFHAYPSVSLPLEGASAFFRPKLGVDYTHYELDRNSVSPATLAETRVLPILSLDGGMLLERDWTWRDKGYLQTLEPRLYYVHIPYRDQSALPVFDTGLADLSLGQLFSENQFIGVDRINDANQLTAAVTSRIVEPGNGLERLQLTLGQRFYFDNPRVVLPGGTPRGNNVTDLLALVSGQISDRWRMSSGIQYNPDDGELARANAGAAYRAGPGRVVNLDLRYINDRYASGLNQGVNQADLSWQWPLQDHWYGLGRINYSFKDNRLAEGLLGFEYNAGCWSWRGVLQQLATTSDNSSTAFYIQLELRGLTQLGPNPLDLLQRSISGYGKSDEFDLTQ